MSELLKKYEMCVYGWLNNFFFSKPVEKLYGINVFVQWWLFVTGGSDIGIKAPTILDNMS